jgi:Heterokaryon incompatibility protein (HET)
MVRYRDLRSSEIRVIKLFTDQDDPKFAFGPIHCSLEYVSLEKPHLDTNDGQKLLTKGYSSTWPCPAAEDIETQPGWRDSLWRKSVRGNPPSNKETSPNKPLSLDCLNRGVEINGEDAELRWRYEWGDYVALSYVWGDSTIKRRIFVDGTPMAITQNLEAALYQLRNYPRVKQGFRIWADAICINQDDLNERAKQVARMKHIYASAWHIVIWLGTVSYDSDLAMTAVRYLSIRSREDSPLEEVYHRVEKIIINIPYMRWIRDHVSMAMRKEVFLALYNFLARPYFRRLWVLQEIASGARRAPVMCGTRCVLLDDIYRTLRLLRDVDGTELGSQIICSTKGTFGMVRSWDQLPSGIDTYTISEKLWERPIAIIEAQNVAHADRESCSP